MTSPTPFTVDPVLTAIAVDFKNPDVSLVADDVMPIVPVMGPDFKWTFYPPDQMFTVPDTLVGRKGVVPQVEFSGEQRTGSVEDHGLDDVVPQSDIDKAAAGRASGTSAFDPEARATEGLTHLLDLRREKRVADVVQDQSNYDADKKTSLGAGDKFSDHATSKPITLIKNAMDATFIARPNIGVIGRLGWTALSTHPDILKAINRTAGDRGVASREAVAELFELKEIIVGDSFLNTAAKGQAVSYQRVWGNSMALLHRNQMAGPDSAQMGWGWTAEYDGRFSSTFFDPKVGLKGAKTIRVGRQIIEVVAAPSTGYLIQATT